MDSRYAIKQVREDLPASHHEDACICLEREAMFLSLLSHPNIIKIQ
jgi:hypothetical protein